MWRASWIVVAGLAGCGRVGFDPLVVGSGDGGADAPAGPCVSGGTGQVGDPFVLCTEPELLALMNPGASGMWSAAFRLGADLDLAAYSESSTPPVRPIGDATTPFSGIFDGGGHKIVNLKMSLPSQDHLGMFGLVSGPQASIRDLNLVGAQVDGNSFVGALVGWLDGGATVTHCTSSGSVTAENRYAGGLVGIVGGVWVTAGTPATVSRSASSASVRNVSGDDWVGGLVGNIADMGVCADSYATGTVTVRLDFGGGLAGGSTGIIRNSYATGPSTGTLSIAGLAGGSGGAVINSFATGDVSGMDGTLTGHLVGNSFGTMMATASASFTPSTCTTQINGPCHAPITGETSVGTLAQLLDTSMPPMSAWDFTNVWVDHGPGQYPTLR